MCSVLKETIHYLFQFIDNLAKVSKNWVGHPWSFTKILADSDSEMCNWVPILLTSFSFSAFFCYKSATFAISKLCIRYWRKLFNLESESLPPRFSISFILLLSISNLLFMLSKFLFISFFFIVNEQLLQSVNYVFGIEGNHPLLISIYW